MKSLAALSLAMTSVTVAHARSLALEEVVSMMDRARAEGRAGQARKARPVDVRPARAGEVVVTVIAGEGKETTSKPARAGDWWRYTSRTFRAAATRSSAPAFGDLEDVQERRQADARPRRRPHFAIDRHLRHPDAPGGLEHLLDLPALLRASDPAVEHQQGGQPVYPVPSKEACMESRRGLTRVSQCRSRPPCLDVSLSPSLPQGYSRPSVPRAAFSQREPPTALLMPVSRKVTAPVGGSGEADRLRRRQAD